MSDPRESTCCKNCGAKIRQQSVKALDGNWAMCWVAEDGEWICEDDANEHEPESPDSTYRRDLDFATEGMTASELLVDAVFNDVVSDVENHGHSRTRIERDLRAWIEDEGAETLSAPERTAASRSKAPLRAGQRARRRRFLRAASVPAAIGAVLLAGCGTASPEQPATATPTPSAYTWGTVVDMDAYGDLVDLVHGDPDELIYDTCQVDSPRLLIEQGPQYARQIKLAVMAGCPDRKDW